ncbi:MAG TPA: sigma-70 family RNA polymerase sigma factor [Verrucomicrobiae bacterium]|nr:sigma-70 family RNA polymerase sigma factor [Verrucomicrobiae bacterium]
MQDQSDIQLLRAYADSGSDVAFRELVTRHTDFVFSAALRQVESPDLAADLAQGVFTDLARKARPVADKMSAHSSLAGWLHRSTRYAALNHLRDTRRRQSNERQAMEQLLTDTGSTPDWEHIRPVLDEALDSLADEDREALLLRYFKNQDYRAIGLALGTSDDTAQKRVTRAVDRLRDYFSRRNVTIGASGLVVLISANAIQAAPAGLAATITTAALASTATASASLVAATKTIVMTTLQKTLIATSLAVVAGAGVYQAHQAHTLRSQVQDLQQQQAPFTGQLQQMQQERDAATNRIADLQAELARAGRNNAELLKLRGQAAQLQTLQQQQQNQSNRAAMDPNDPAMQRFLAARTVAEQITKHLDDMPDKSIPELKLLTDVDWLNATKDAKFDTDADTRNTLSKLRSLAKNRLPIGRSLNAFIQANNNQLPTDLSQLKPYVESTLASLGQPALDDTTLDAILARYSLVHTGDISDYPTDTYFVIENAPVDKEYDSRAKFGNGRSSVYSTGLGQSGDPDDKSY